MYGFQQHNRNMVPPKGHLIKVSGEGEMAVQPDMATINLGVITESKEVVPGQKQNSAAINQVIQAILNLGIPKKDLQTFEYRVDSEYDFHDGKQIFRGYKITHILQIKIEDLSLVGKVVDTALDSGGNYVSNVQFKVKDKDAYYNQALVLALNQAIEKAKTIAATLNVTLIPTPNVVVEGGSPIEPIFPQPGTYVKGVSTTNFEPGQLMVKASVTAEFRYI